MMRFSSLILPAGLVALAAACSSTDPATFGLPGDAAAGAAGANGSFAGSTGLPTGGSGGQAAENGGAGAVGGIGGIGPTLDAGGPAADASPDVVLVDATDLDGRAAPDGPAPAPDGSTGGDAGAAPALDAGPESGAPVWCRSVLDCGSDAGASVCNTQTGECVECTRTADCVGRGECVDNVCVPYSECDSSLDCVGEPDGKTICDTGAGGECVQCVQGADCGPQGRCEDRVCRKECVSDNDCTPQGLLCDFDRGVCVVCTRTLECGPAEHCAEGECVPDVCLRGAQLCDGNAVVTCSDTGDALGDPEPCEAGAQCVEAEGQAFCQEPPGEDDAAVPDSCSNGVRDGDETGIDCGGPDCPPCTAGGTCQEGSDCDSGVCARECSGFFGLICTDRCQAPTCTDGVRNGGETDVDCGGPECNRCEAGRSCSVDDDCLSDDCDSGTCAPAATCTANQCPSCLGSSNGWVRCCTGGNACGCRPYGSTAEACTAS